MKTCGHLLYSPKGKCENVYTVLLPLGKVPLPNKKLTTIREQTCNKHASHTSCSLIWQLKQKPLECCQRDVEICLKSIKTFCQVVMVMSTQHSQCFWYFFMSIADIISNHAVVNCESRALKNHCYWPIVSDFINVLSHKSIAEMFMQNTDLIRQWMKFIEHLTG